MDYMGCMRREDALRRRGSKCDEYRMSILLVFVNVRCEGVSASNKWVKKFNEEERASKNGENKSFIFPSHNATSGCNFQNS